MTFKKTPTEIRELSVALFPRTNQILKQAVLDQVAPGFVAGVWNQHQPNHFFIQAFGSRTLLPTPEPMMLNTLFDIASLTKVFLTAPLCASLVEQKKMSWNTSLKSLLPEYGDTIKNPSRGLEIQVNHLLSHTSGLPAWEPFYKSIRAGFSEPLDQVPFEKKQVKMKELLMQTEPIAAPKEQCIYSDLGFLLLGYALERICQQRLDQIAFETLWKPMGLSASRFFPIGESQLPMNANIAATEECEWRKMRLLGQVHDDNAWAMGGVAGHAGVFSTAEDLLKFSQHLLIGFFSPPILSKMWRVVQVPKGCGRTAGWDTRLSTPAGKLSSCGTFLSVRSVGHLGYTGTSLWIDPLYGLAIVLLSNRVYFGRENIKIQTLRPQFHDALWLDLQDQKK